MEWLLLKISRGLHSQDKADVVDALRTPQLVLSFRAVQPTSRKSLELVVANRSCDNRASTTGCDKMCRFPGIAVKTGVAIATEVTLDYNSHIRRHLINISKALPHRLLYSQDFKMRPRDISPVHPRSEITALATFLN